MKRLMSLVTFVCDQLLGQMLFCMCGPSKPALTMRKKDHRYEFKKTGLWLLKSPFNVAAMCFLKKNCGENCGSNTYMSSQTTGENLAVEKNVVVMCMFSFCIE